MQSFAQNGKSTIMCQFVYKELNDLLRGQNQNQPFLWDFRRKGEAFILEHMQNLFKSDIEFAALDDGHTQNKSTSKFDFEAMDGGQKLLLGLTEAASAR